MLEEEVWEVATLPSPQRLIEESAHMHVHASELRKWRGGPVWRNHNGPSARLCAYRGGKWTWCPFSVRLSGGGKANERCAHRRERGGTHGCLAHLTVGATAPPQKAASPPPHMPLSREASCERDSWGGLLPQRCPRGEKKLQQQQPLLEAGVAPYRTE